MAIISRQQRNLSQATCLQLLCGKFSHLCSLGTQDVIYMSGDTGMDYGSLIKINHVTGKILGWRMTQLLKTLIA